MNPLLLMPPSERFLPNAYRNLMTLAFGGEYASTIEDHTKFIVRFIIQKRPDIVEHLPFQNKVDIWDCEYAVNRLIEVQDMQRKAMINCPTYVYIDYIDYSGETPVPRSEMVTAYTGGYRRNNPRSVPRGWDSVEESEPEDSDEEECPSDVAFYMYYYKEMQVTKRVRYRVTFEVDEGSNLSTHDFQERIREMVNDGDYNIRQLDTNEEVVDSEFHHDYIDWASDNGLEASVSDPFCLQVVQDINSNY